MIWLNAAAGSEPKLPELISALPEFLKTSELIDPARLADHMISGICQSDNNWKSSVLTSLGLADDNPNTVCFQPSCTHALNSVIFGYYQKTINQNRNHRLKKTNIARPTIIADIFSHNAVLRPLYSLANADKINLLFWPGPDFKLSGQKTFIPPQLNQVETYLSTSKWKDSCKYLTDLEEALIEFPEALVITTTRSNVLSLKRDRKMVADLKLKYPFTWLEDGAQSFGLESLKNILPDFYAFTGHKYAQALPGIGGLWARDFQRIEAVFLGGTGSHSENPSMPNTKGCEALEMATPNLLAQWSLKFGLDFIQSIGQDVYAADIQKSASCFQNVLRTSNINYLQNDELISEASQLPHTFLMANNEMHPLELATILREVYSIQVRTGLHCAPLAHVALTGDTQGRIRIAFGFGLKQAEINQAGQAISSLWPASLK